MPTQRKKKKRRRTEGSVSDAPKWRTRKPKNVSLMIEDIMKKHEISQYKLAQKMGLQVGHIWKIFTEKNPNPTIAMLEAIGEALSNLTGEKIRIRDLIKEK